MEGQYIIRDIVCKTTYKDKEGKEITKWHNMGSLFMDSEGKQFGTIKVWGHPVKFSVFDKKEITGEKQAGDQSYTATPTISGRPPYPQYRPSEKESMSEGIESTTPF